MTERRLPGRQHADHPDLFGRWSTWPWYSSRAGRRLLARLPLLADHALW